MNIIQLFKNSTYFLNLKNTLVWKSKENLIKYNLNTSIQPINREQDGYSL